MTNLTKLFLIIGCVLLLTAVILRLTWFPIEIAARPIKSISLVLLANTFFILACLFKK